MCVYIYVPIWSTKATPSIDKIRHLYAKSNGV